MSPLGPIMSGLGPIMSLLLTIFSLFPCIGSLPMGGPLGSLDSCLAIMSLIEVPLYYIPPLVLYPLL